MENKKENKDFELVENKVKEESAIEEPSEKAEESVSNSETLEQPQEVEKSKYASQELQEIEDARSVFLKEYRSGNRIKSLIFIFVLIILCASFIIIPNIAQGASYQLPLMLGIASAVLASIIVYTVLTKRKMKRKMHDYFEVFYGNVSKYVFGNKNYKEVKFENPGKIEDHLFLDSDLYINILEVRSRGATTFQYKGKPMIVCDCAGSIKTENRVAPVFVGKYLVSGNSYKGTDQIIIYIKGDKRSLPPTNLEDKKIVFDDKNMVIYTNNKKWKDVVTSEIMKKLVAIKPNKELVDIAISIKANESYVAMGYDDPLMVVPLEQEFNAKPVEYYKKDVAHICELLKELD